MLGQSHAVTPQKTPDRQRGESTNPNISGILFTVVLLFCFRRCCCCFFSASTRADVVLALFRAAASVASGNLGFSALLSAHSEVSV